jgi:hypothetical protein
MVSITSDILTFLDVDLICRKVCPPYLLCILLFLNVALWNMGIHPIPYILMLLSVDLVEKGVYET